MTGIDILNLLVLIAVLSLVLLVIFFKKSIKVFFQKLYLKVQTKFPNKEQPFQFERTIKNFRMVFFVIVFEFFLISFFLSINLKINDLIANYLNSMNVSNLTDFLKKSEVYNFTCGNQTGQLIGGLNFSFENLSILIAALTGLFIYTYFFRMIGEDPNNSIKSETRKKYYWFFENLFWISLAYTFLVILGVSLGMKIDIFISSLLVFAWFNIFLLIPISTNLRKISENYDNIEKFNKIINENSGIIKYSILGKGDAISIYIFFMTLEFAYFGYAFSLNIFSLILVESSLILMHIWVSRISQIPTHKQTIELTSGSPLKDVYIINDIPDEYYVVVSKDIGVCKVMKSSVKQISKTKGDSS